MLRYLNDSTVNVPYPIRKDHEVTVTRVKAEFVPVPRALPPARDRSDEQKSFDVDVLEALESGEHVVAYSIEDNEEARKMLLAHLRSAVRWVNKLSDAEHQMALRQGQDGHNAGKGRVAVVYALVKARKREPKVEATASE